MLAIGFISFLILSQSNSANGQDVEGISSLDSTLSGPFENATSMCPELEYMCQDKCIYKGRPCDGVCFSPDSYITCDGVCLNYYNIDVGFTWLCDGQCISIETPCNGQCATFLGPCKFPFKAANRSLHYGCFWDSWDEKYKCPVEVNLFGTLETTIECPKDCHKDCAENEWKCDDRCIPLNQTCHNECFEANTHKCGDICLSFKKSCNGVCKEKSAASFVDVGGDCIDESLTWMCNGKNIFKRDICNGTCYKSEDESYLECPKLDKCALPSGFCNDYFTSNICPNNQQLSREVCEKINNVPQENLELDQQFCSGNRKSQVFFRYTICDGIFDCMDRSDESNCFNKDHTSDPSVLKHCSNDFVVNGFYCNEDCVSIEEWFRKSTNFKYRKSCPEIYNTINTRELKMNVTFWGNISCSGFQCTGNFPYQCFYRYQRETFQCSFDKTLELDGQCDDKSHFICKKSTGFCNQPFMKMCHDNDTCIHQDLFCDGYLHCPDESDEIQSVCGTCPREFGYPTGKLNLATVSCTHRYTGKKICTIPCDEVENNLCLEDFEEVCKSAKIQLTILVGLALFILTIIVGELSLKFFQKKQNFDDLSVNHLALYDLIFDVKNSKNMPKLHLKRFKHLHNNVDYFKNSKVCLQKMLYIENYNTEEMKNNLQKLEVWFHHGNEYYLGLCYKANHRNLHQMDKSPSILSKLMSKIYSIPGVIHLRFLILLAQRLFTYYADTFKDFYIVVEYAKIFPWSEHNFLTFGYQVFVLLVFSITVPSVLNLAFITLSKTYKYLKMSFVILLPFCPIIPALTIYSSSKYELLFLNEIQHLKKEEKVTDIHSIKKIEYYEKNFHKWTSLNADLRANENATEHIIQIVVVIFLIAIKYSHSVSTSTNLEELFVGNEVTLLVLSALWSILSLIRGHLSSLTVKKEIVPSLTGQLVFFCFILSSLLVRIFAILLFFVPPLGLFDLLMHWNFGKMSTGGSFIYDVYENGTVIPFREAWIQIQNYDELTGLKLETYYQIFVALACCHFIAIAVLKLKFSRKFKSKKDICLKIFHLIHQATIPSIYTDWDEKDLSGELDVYENWRKTMKEMSNLLIIFTLEHLVCCIPIFILSVNIAKRNQYLDKYFPQLIEERNATQTAFCLASISPVIFILAPFIQFWLFKIYNLYFHPWAILLNPQGPKYNKQLKQKLKGIFVHNRDFEDYHRHFWTQVETEMESRN